MVDKKTEYCHFYLDKPFVRTYDNIMTKNHKAFMFLRGLSYPDHLLRRAVVVLSGYTQEELANKIASTKIFGKVDTGNFAKTISGVRSPKHIQKAIADELGIPPEEMFKDYK